MSFSGSLEGREGGGLGEGSPEFLGVIGSTALAGHVEGATGEALGQSVCGL